MTREQRERATFWLNPIMAAVVATLLVANLKETYELGKEVARLRVEVKQLTEHVQQG